MQALLAAVKVLYILSGIKALVEKWLLWRQAKRAGIQEEQLASRNRELEQLREQEQVAADARSSMDDPDDRAKWLRNRARDESGC